MPKALWTVPIVFILATAHLAHAREDDARKGAREPAPPMSVEDFVLDKDELGGRLVAVTGSAWCMGVELCSLASEKSLATTVMFNPRSLPRDVRKRLLECNPFTDPCVATVSGRATADIMTGIIATSLSFAPTDEELAATDASLPTCDTASTDDIKGIAEGSTIARLANLQIMNVKIDAVRDDQGHLHCTADIFTNAGAKSLKYYFKREGSDIMIIGSWLK